MIFLLSLLVFGEAVWADKPKKVDLRPKHEKFEDPGSATPLIYKSPAETKSLQEKGSKTKVYTTCVDSLGMVQKEGEPGYQTCVQNLNKAVPPGSAADKRSSGTGISIGN